MEFEKRMLLEMRMLVMAYEEKQSLSDEAMVEAVTMNEKLSHEAGYIFAPKDLVTIAKAGIAEAVYRKVMAYLPQVKGKPMYPDFPAQVMDISEAEFRFHQYVHYFSTYGMEYFFDVEVHHGWLPAEDATAGITETAKTKEDVTMLNAKVIELVPASEAHYRAYAGILSRRERMSQPQEELLKEAVINVSLEEMQKTPVKFKENMEVLFAIVMDTYTGLERLERLASLCQHTGDVLRGFDRVLHVHKFDVPTSIKRAVVQLLERYPIADFQGNIMLSRTRREDTLTLLQMMDYNTYSRSPKHKEAVQALRDKKLRTWESRFVELLHNDPSAALEFVGQRPGVLLRKVNQLIQAGICSGDIVHALCEKADQLSTQTLVRLCECFSDADMLAERWKDKDIELLEDVFCTVLLAKLTKMHTPLQGKKVYIDEEQYDFANSYIETNEKSQEGGYIRSGMAFHIPDDAAVVRFFTYWNDPRRIDIDLHAFMVNAKKEIEHIGWNADFRNDCAVHSGDITHSNAAEYIDIDMQKAKEAGISHIGAHIHSYTQATFDQIQEVLVGMMAVSKLGLETDVKLYAPKNCFFYHELNTNTYHLLYGRIDIQRNILTFMGKDEVFVPNAMPIPRFSLTDYLHLLLEAQNASLVSSTEEADIILKQGKPVNDKDISLADANYFMDAQA
ncbi:MAG: hypothetical protein IKS37_04250 [Solobacterium sp.]|nr:hypothetical protein [Solobacterium sp.]